jgi:hypothetical protein
LVDIYIDGTIPLDLNKDYPDLLKPKQNPYITFCKLIYEHPSITHGQSRYQQMSVQKRDKKGNRKKPIKMESFVNNNHYSIHFDSFTILLKNLKNLFNIVGANAV